MAYILSLIAVSLASFVPYTSAMDNQALLTATNQAHYENSFFNSNTSFFNTIHPAQQSPSSFFDAPSSASQSGPHAKKLKEAEISLDCADKVQTVNAGDSAVYEFSFTQLGSEDEQWHLSLASALPGAALSTRYVSTSSKFALTVPTQAKTQYGSYTFTVTAGNAQLIEQAAVTLNVIPKGAQSYSYTNNDALDIEDNGSNSAQSTIFVPHDLTTFTLEVDLAVRHSWQSDLEVVLVSPTGNQHVLHNRDGGSSSDINQHYKVNTFNGERAYGPWTLRVSDKAPGNIGRLNHWNLRIIGFATTS